MAQIVTMNWSIYIRLTGLIKSTHPPMTDEPSTSQAINIGTRRTSEDALRLGPRKKPSVNIHLI